MRGTERFKPCRYARDISVDVSVNAEVRSVEILYRWKGQKKLVDIIGQVYALSESLRNSLQFLVLKHRASPSEAG